MAEPQFSVRSVLHLAHRPAWRENRAIADIDLEAVIGEYHRPHTGSDP